MRAIVDDLVRTVTLLGAACFAGVAPAGAAASASGALSSQERGADATKKPAEPQKPILDDKDAASKLLREAEKGLTDRAFRLRVAALEPFRIHRHDSYVKRLVAMLKDAQDEVAIAAARALANQPFAATTDALLDFACSEKTLAARPEVCAEAIRALGAVGFGKKGFERVRDRFDRGETAVKIAIFRAFVDAKEKRAFSFFVDHLDAPAPEDAASASNPPESYWRERHAEWAAYAQHVKKGLRELTGQSLTTKSEWKEWAGGAGKEQGFVYSKGS